MRKVVASLLVAAFSVATPAHADQYDEWMNTPDYKGSVSTKSGNFKIVCQGRDDSRTCRFFSEKAVNLFRVDLFIEDDWVGRVDDTPHLKVNYKARGSISSQVIPGVRINCRVRNTTRDCNVFISNNVHRFIGIGYVNNEWDSQFAYRW